MRFKLLFLLIVVLNGARCTREGDKTSVVTKKVSIESSCFSQNKSFIGQYFSGQFNKPYALDRFFDCLDNLIQALLNHTRTGHPDYYTQVELSRFILYMGGDKTAKTEKQARAKADSMSQALLNLKAGFIGGPVDKLSLKEIKLCRQILSIFRERMRELLPFIPQIAQALLGEDISKRTLNEVTHTVQKSLKTLSKELAKLSFAVNLSLLETAQQNLEVLFGLSSRLDRLKSSVHILAQWQKIFSSSGQVIKSVDLPPLLQSFGDISAIWLHHSRFLKGKFYLDYTVLPDTQYFLSRSLEVVEKALKSSNHKQIALKDVEELARRIWFVPILSKPVFRLGLRSFSCFLLKPLSENKVCKQSLHFEKTKIEVRWTDLIWTMTKEHKIQESPTNQKGDFITLADLKILRQYLDSWSQAEQQIRNKGVLPSLFGSPNQWLNRKIGKTGQGRLAFRVLRNENKTFLSWLNWQSHLMKLFATAYTNRGASSIDQKLWNKMIKEWTAFAVAIYPPLEWEQFQKTGYQVFYHGDFIMSQSNGDRVLQEEELLELFALSISALDTLYASLKLTKHCSGAPPYSLPMDCLFDTLGTWPRTVFEGFPVLTQTFLTDKKAQEQYINTLKSFYGDSNVILHKDVFKLFLIAHYQENMMEHLDKDHSFNLNAQELMALMPVFEQTIIEDIPLFYNKREAFAFITYLFYYGELPILGEGGEISAPVRFSNWLLNPEKWHIQADQTTLLKVIFLVSETGDLLNLQ